MRSKVIKEVDAIVCDACGNEIEHGKDYCYHRMMSKVGEDVIKSEKYNVKHYLFGWTRREPKQEYVTYDFHPECLDKIIREYLDEPKTAS